MRQMVIGDVLTDIDTGEPVPRPVLREYQQRAVDAVRGSINADCRKIVMVLPTGAGKSIIFAEIIRLAADKGKTVLWLVHRRNLVHQMADTLRLFGIDAGIIMAGVDSQLSNKVQIGTYQTYHRRLNLQDGRFFINADMLLIDEAHRSISEKYVDIIERYADKVIIGCTATPMRADGRGMGQVYDKIVDVVGAQELTDGGFLAEAKYFVPPGMDTSGIKIVRGDYDTKTLEEKANTTKLVGDIVQNWLKFAQNRPTIVFCVTVKHSIHIAEEFVKNGIQALHLDAKSSDDEREEAFQKMESGEITVLCNVALYQEGMDCPNIAAVVMARPTKSLGLYRQCCGRGLRPKKNLSDCIILDHGGVVEEHGLLTDEIEWTLVGKEKAWKKKEKKEKEEKIVVCSVCHAIFVKGEDKCPDCGSPMKTFGKKIDIEDGELKEIGQVKYSKADKRRYFGMCIFYQRSKGYKPGWAANKYKGKTGVWPRGMDDVQPIQPDQEFMNYIRYEQIKYAKSRGQHGH